MTSIAERMKALAENQAKWKERIVREKPTVELATVPVRKSLESRRMALEQSTDEWRKKRQSTVEAVEAIKTPVSKSGRSVPLKRMPPLHGCQSEGAAARKNSRHEEYDSGCSVSLEKQSIDVELSQKEEERTPAGEVEMNNDVSASLLATPKRALPPRVVGRRLPSRLQKASPTDIVNERENGTNNSQPDATETSSSADKENARVRKSASKTFDLGREFDRPPAVGKEIDGSRARSLTATPLLPFQLPADAFQTPIIGREHCGVKLRQTDRTSPFPDQMLVRFSNSRPLDVRLVYPKVECVDTLRHSYLLVTRTRLIVYNAPEATVMSKSKASQMAYDILASKELSCTAAKVELADDDFGTLSAFKRLLNPTLSLAKRETSEVETNESVQECHAEVEDCDLWADDTVYAISDDGEVEMICSAEPPSLRHFDPAKVLIFDFLSEIYVWIGHGANGTHIQRAVKHAQQLRDLPLKDRQLRLLGYRPPSDAVKNPTGRPSWIVHRKQTQGIVDCLLRHKFDGWAERMIELSGMGGGSISPQRSATPAMKKRPWSVPASSLFAANVTPALMENRLSMLCSENAFFGILKDEERLVDELATRLVRNVEPVKHCLQLDGMELRETNKNVFTERLTAYWLVGEELMELDAIPLEFDDRSCYVIRWNYRIEREGIKRLNGDDISVHDTGRQRVAWFYWLGARSTVKDQSFCALALRNLDKDRCEHIRIEQGYEPPVFLSLFDGKMLISGTHSNRFLVIGALLASQFSAEELDEPLGFCRPQAAYLQIVDDKVQCMVGADCSDPIKVGAQLLAERLAESRDVTAAPQPSALDPKTVLTPVEWGATREGPRLYRIYGSEGEELAFRRYSAGINFTFRQEDLKDCILVEQGATSRLWIWSDAVVSTFALKVADKFWYELRRKRETDGDSVIIDTSATVISKGREPDDFRALFPTWKPFEPADDAIKPQPLKSLLHVRTRSRTIDELRRRDLPKGCDTKRLERYLTDVDFEAVFKCTKEAYEKLPKWKQISLKKQADLF